jgi:hypothetical protein
VTIRRGEPWGEIVTPPANLHLLGSDTALHHWIVRHRSAGEPVAPVGIFGGDLARTVGGGAERFTGQVAKVPLDLVRVEAEGATTWSVAHVVARRSWWHGPLVLAMTAQFLGGLDVAPRSHPNDGRVDVLSVDAEMPVRARLTARSRARSGSHLPHPQLTMTQVTEVRLEFDRRVVVWVDGERFATSAAVQLTVEPDAYTAYV